MAKNVLEVDDATFDEEVLRANTPVLVEFGGKWCGPCKALAPILAKIADENVGQVKVVCVDIDEAPAVTKRYGVRGVPTVLAFTNGAPTGQIVGLTSRDALMGLVR